MVKVLAFIPNGFSNKQKSSYINGLKDALQDSFGIAHKDSRVYITNCLPEDSSENYYKRLSANLYIPEGKTDEQKQKFAKLYKDACESAFGAEALPSFSIINEHTLDEECNNGIQLSKANQGS